MNMENKKSDVKAKRAFCDELLKRGYDAADIVSAPADIKATKDGLVWYYEIKMTRRTDTYFGAATATEWAQAFQDPDHYRFVIAQTDENENEFKFLEFTPKEFMKACTIPPFKIYFNIDMQTGTPIESNHRDGTVVLTKEAFDCIHNAYTEAKNTK